jgi:hypothetical protein
MASAGNLSAFIACLTLGFPVFAEEPLPIKPGATLEATLTGGESAFYVFTVAANHYLEFQVEQIGIDVAVRLLDSQGKLLFEVDSPNGSFGPEPVFWITGDDGGHRLEVLAPNKRAAPGRYRLLFQTNRPAAEQDKNAVAGQRAYLEALKLGTAGKYAAADEKYDDAIARLNSAGKKRLAAQVMRVYDGLQPRRQAAGLRQL